MKINLAYFDVSIYSKEYLKKFAVCNKKKIQRQKPLKYSKGNHAKYQRQTSVQSVHCTHATRNNNNSIEINVTMLLDSDIQK